MKLNRRNILQLLGLAGASYAAGSTLLGASPVRAGNPSIPKRIVFFYTEHGTLKQFNGDGSLQPFWTPTIAASAPDAFSIQKPWSTTDFTLRDIHQPLVSRQKDILLLDGIDMVSSTVDPTGAANSHYGGETHALVAANRQSGSLAGGPSIDQFIAQSLNSPSPLTVLPSLETYISPWQQDAGGGAAEASPLYVAAGQPIPIYGNAGKIYDRMFPNGPGATTAEEKAKQARLLAQQTSVIEAAYARYKTVSPRGSSLDKLRLDAHAQALRDLEKRLALSSASSCDVPDKSITAGAVVNSVPGQEGESYKTNADVLMHLVQTALACDLTRVATMYVPVPPNDVFGYVPSGGTTDFHDMVHKTNGASPALAADAVAIGVMKSYQTYNATLFAKFLDLLAAIPEADGTTLLDNTLVVWCGQIAAGDHSLDHIPYVLAGNMGGSVKTGRYVRYPRVKDMNAWPVYSQGPAHNDLFVSFANMMGVETNTFGNPAVCKGPIAGLAG